MAEITNENAFDRCVTLQQEAQTFRFIQPGKQIMRPQLGLASQSFLQLHTQGDSTGQAAAVAGLSFQPHHPVGRLIAGDKNAAIQQKTADDRVVLLPLLLPGQTLQRLAQQQAAQSDSRDNFRVLADHRRPVLYRIAGPLSEEVTAMRWAVLFLMLVLVAPSWAKRPQAVPAHRFAIRLPSDWVSPGPDQWCTPDGHISLVWSELEVKIPPSDWAAQSQKRFPGPLLNKDLKLQLGGQPAWHFVGQHEGRIQRVYLGFQQGHGVILVCSCTPAQNFATIGIVSEILNSFRWLPQPSP